MPFVERLPDAHGGLAKAIVKDVETHCAAAGRAPDAALLARARVALGEG